MKTKKIISTAKAPAAIGPYNQAVECNGMLFISGQIPLNPSIGKVIEGDITAQTEQVFSNISAILTEADYQFTDVVKTTVFIADMSLFAAVNEVYKRYYQTNCPARSTVAVKGLPLGVLVEIETIAMK
jgi:2-iminobutanoate/2-iminopropanoate deaminase